MAPRLPMRRFAQPGQPHIMPVMGGGVGAAVICGESLVRASCSETTPVTDSEIRVGSEAPRYTESFCRKGGQAQMGDDVRDMWVGGEGRRTRT